MKRILLTLLIALVVAGAAALATGVFAGDGESQDAAHGEAAEAADAAQTATPVRVVPAHRGPVTLSLETTSAVEAERTAKVLPQTSGLLTEIRVREGDTVASGTVLARVDDRDRRLAFEQAKLRLSRAEAEHTRQQRAFERDLVAEYDLEKALFDRDLAASELETARLALDRTEIRAPFAGRITEVLLVEGEHLNEAQHLLTIADFGTLIARLYLPERDVAGLAPGQPAVVRPESAPAGAGLAGHIREVSPVVDQATGTVKVTVAIPAAAARSSRRTAGGAAVRPGSFARVVIETGRREDAVLAPKRAVIREGNGAAHVFVVENGKAVRREVTVGAELDTAEGALIELVSGLETGAQVVVAGHAALAAGASVEVLPTS